MKKILVLVLLALLFVMLAGCASGSSIDFKTSDGKTQSIQINTPGANPEVNKPDANGQVANLALGFWHGLIAPITLVVSFFNENVQMYDVFNNGNQYNLGFLIGVAVVFGILGILGGRRR